MFIEADILITVLFLFVFIVYLAHEVGKRTGIKEQLRKNPEFVKAEKIKGKM